MDTERSDPRPLMIRQVWTDIISLGVDVEEYPNTCLRKERLWRLEHLQFQEFLFRSMK